MTEATEAAAIAAAPEIRRITAKEFLALSKADRPKILKESLVVVKINEEVEMGINVRQLTKSQTGLLNTRVLDTMPEVPTIEHTYETLHTDPATGKARRPGKYREPNPEDIKYKQELEVWFNDACVWMALLSAADDLGVTAENLDLRFNEIGDELPGPALLRVAIEAARVNEGLNLADQLMNQVRNSEAIQAQLKELEALHAEAQSLHESQPELPEAGEHTEA